MVWDAPSTAIPPRGEGRDIGYRTVAIEGASSRRHRVHTGDFIQPASGAIFGRVVDGKAGEAREAGAAVEHVPVAGCCQSLGRQYWSRGQAAAVVEHFLIAASLAAGRGINQRGGG